MNARRWLFFDTETQTRFKDSRGNRLTFLLAYAVYCEFDQEYNMVKMEGYEIKTPGEFIALLVKLASQQTRLYVTAHNLAFDLQILNLPHALQVAGFTSDLPVLSWGACMWSVRLGKKSIHFFDSQNIFPGKLESLGKDVGRPKLKIDFGNFKHDKLMEYCANDCHILRVAFTKYLQWLSDNQLGYFAETTSWQAFVAFRTRFLSTGIHIHVDYSVLSYEREAYHGARTECFFVGKAPEQLYTLLDVNSMYAHVMRENEFPVEYLDLEIRPSIARLETLMSQYYVIAQCEVDCDEAAYPVRTLTKLVFPTGRFTTWLHHSEIQAALRAGSLQRVHFCLTYRHDVLFRDYVDFFSDRRRQASDCGNRTEERLAKQFLVSLYGKFGQKNPVTFHQGHTDDPGVRYMPAKHVESGRHWDEWHWFGEVYQTVKVGEKPYACPSIAGAITAYGRVYLWELLQEAGHENVFYCDTDSLIVDSVGLSRLSGRLDDHRLGWLKRVSESCSLAIYGPKDYALGEQRKRKGSSAGAIITDTGAARQEQFRSLSYRMKSGDIEGVDVYEVLKQRRATYDKGRIQESGRVCPWQLPGDLDRPVFQT